MIKRIGAHGLVVLLLAACSSDGEPVEQTREEFCGQWAREACSAEVVSVCQAGEASDCRLAQERFCQELLPDGFEDDHARRCLDAVGSAYSDADLTADELATVLQLGPPCDRLVRGPVEEGDACQTNTDCNTVGNYACVAKGAEGTGTCQVPRIVQPGLECGAPQETCTEGFYCNGDNCIAGKDVGDDCSLHEECAAENYCGAGGTCAERLDLGESCSADHECRSGICFAFGDERSCVDRIRLSPSEPLCEQLR
jgi:hypothetical protein